MEIAFAEIARLTAAQSAAARPRRRPGRARAAPVAGRPRAAAPAHRPDRQHPPRRVLHRQDVQPRLLARPARPARAARLRDAAAPADGAAPGAAGAQPGRDVLGAAAARAAGALGHRAARGLPAAARRDPRHRARSPPTCARSASPSRTPGWTRSPSSASRGSGWPTVGERASSSSCARPSSRGTCSARRPPAGGTARYVDSSVERLQVSVRGIDPERHLVTCQGVPVPLTSTGRPGEHYAGIRFRAWQPWSALHPSIEVHAPLHVEVVDLASADQPRAARRTTWSTRAAAPTTTRRSTRSEAEARRASRFEPLGLTAGPARRRRDAGGRPPGRVDGVPAHPRPAAGAAEGSSVTVLRDYATALAQPLLVDEPARYDEVVGPDGALRPAWKGIAESVVRITAGDLRRADGDILAMLADDGVTYARPGEGPGPWQLDPVPLLIDAAVVVAARGRAGPARRAAQRDPGRPVRRAAAARRRRSSRRRWCSATPASPGWWPGRPRSTRGRWCSRATDLGRDAEGRWRVLADRAQAPSGIGYAMENRRVISRVLPELYREAGLHRMEPYFWALRSALLQSAQGDLADPRVVVLSPGHALGDRLRPGLRGLGARLPAGAGQRPRGARRLGLDAVARPWRRRPARAGRRDPAPGRRGVERPARAARRLPARGGRAGRGGTPRPGADRQRAGRRRAREPRAAALPAGGLRGAARRAAAARLGAAPGGAATPTRSTTCCRGSTGCWCGPSTGRRCRTRWAAGSSSSASSPRRTAGSARSGCRSRRRRPGAPAAAPAASRPRRR